MPFTAQCSTFIWFRWIISCLQFQFAMKFLRRSLWLIESETRFGFCVEFSNSIAPLRSNNKCVSIWKKMFAIVSTHGSTFNLIAVKPMTWILRTSATRAHSSAVISFISNSIYQILADSRRWKRVERIRCILGIFDSNLRLWRFSSSYHWNFDFSYFSTLGKGRIFHFFLHLRAVNNLFGAA